MNNTTAPATELDRTPEVGDFMVSSWGYDQTNIDFYKVVKVTPKSVRLQRWTSTTVGSNGYHDQVVPGDGPMLRVDWNRPDAPVNGDHWERKEWAEQNRVPVTPVTKRVRYYNGCSYSVSMTSYANAYYWGGQPANQTGAGYGH